ncbi:hypothetical protein [Luteimonas huabeiensis]|nr:hypothetical protein [Luteimonas huabeiensis]
MPSPTHPSRLGAALHAALHAADLDAVPDRTARTDPPAGPLGRDRV